MRRREREKLAEEIREAADVLHSLVRRAREENIEITSPHWLSDWPDEEKLKLRLHWTRDEAL